MSNDYYELELLDWWPDVSDFLEFLEFLHFLDCPPSILGGFIWRNLKLVIVRYGARHHHGFLPAGHALTVNTDKGDCFFFTWFSQGDMQA